MVEDIFCGIMPLATKEEINGSLTANGEKNGINGAPAGDMPVELTMLCLQDNVASGKPRHVTIHEVLAICDTPEMHQLIAAIRAARARGDKDELSRLKRQLPSVSAHACGYGGDGSRTDANAQMRKIIGVDLDHVGDNPYGFFQSNIEPKIKRLKIAFVQPSPSGDGIHIFACRHDDETIGAAQQRIAAEIGATDYLDATTRNPSRAFFLSDETYYVNPPAFAYPDLATKQARIAHFTALDGGGVSPQTTRGEINGSLTATACSAGAPAGGVAPVYTAVPKKLPTIPTDYKGMPLRRIIDERLRQLGVVCADNNVYEGNRNSGLKDLFPDMYHILDIPLLSGATTVRTANVPALRAIMAAEPFKNLQLPQAEVDSLLKSAAQWYLGEAKKLGGKLPLMSNEFKNMLTELQIEQRIDDAVMEQMDAEECAATDAIITPRASHHVIARLFTKVNRQNAQR